MQHDIIRRYVGMFNGTQSMGRYLCRLWGNGNVECVGRNAFRVFGRNTIKLVGKKWVVR